MLKQTVKQRLKRALPQNCFLCHRLSDACICPACADSLVSGNSRCLSCAVTLQTLLDYCGECLRAKPPFDRAYALYDYQGALAYLIKQFKYHDQLFLAAFFAAKLNIAIERIYADQPLPKIIAMPLSANKMRIRGFNQVHYLLVKAGRINAGEQLPYSRIKATKTLALLSADDRRKELKSAFSVTATIDAEHILLIDDVMTTGSSFAELTRTLKRASSNIKRVDVLCLARA